MTPEGAGALWLPVLLTAVTAPIAAWWLGSQILRRRNRRLEMLGLTLRNAGVVGTPRFTVPGLGCGVLVAGDHLAFVDLARGELLRVYDAKDIVGIRISQRQRSIIDYRFILTGGATSHELQTRAIVEFVSLFLWLQKYGKQVEFLAP